MTVERPTRLEIHTIQPIAHEERHGRGRDLFTVWFGSNIMLLTIVTGALGVTLFHLPFLWAVAALVVGNLLGAVFMALHAAQGPILGVPQMVQTRGQFGSIGALLVVGVVIVMYVGFFASNLVLGGQAIAAIVPALTEFGAIVVMGVISAAATVLGYDLIHAYARWMSYLAGIVLVATFVWIPAVHGIGGSFWSAGTPSIAGVLGTISVAALWQIAYAPYVSDYTRYMPPDTGVRTAFWATYWGCSLGSILPMILGAILGMYTKGEDVIGAMGAVTGALGPVTFIVFSVAMIATNAMNLYCGALCVLTFGQTIAPRWSPKAGARAVSAVALLILALACAVLGKQSFLVNYTNFLLLLLYVLVPWTAINLVDYYLIRHAKYDVSSFMRADGGIYGRVNVVAVACYLLGILVQVPFMSTPLYTGPIAHQLHGADIAWIVGLAVTAPVFYYLSILTRERRVSGAELSA